jgi:hypothetical protein
MLKNVFPTWANVGAFLQNDAFPPSVDPASNFVGHDVLRQACA